MAAIDVGAGAIDRGGTLGHYTLVDKTNPANLTGTLDHLEAYLNSYVSGNVDFASAFVVSGDNLSTRGVAEGLTPGGTGLQTWDAPGDFTAFEVTAGDYLGIYNGSGLALDRDNSGGSGIWYSFSNDYVPCTNQAFSTIANYKLATYATGVEAAVDDYIPRVIMIG